MNRRWLPLSDDTFPPWTILLLSSGELALEAGCGFASRYRDLCHPQRLGDDVVAPFALPLEVRPVTSRTRRDAVLFHLKPGKLGLQTFDADI